MIENNVVKNTPAEAAFTSPSYSVDRITTIEAEGNVPETTTSDFIKSLKGSFHTNKYNIWVIQLILSQPRYKVSFH